MLLSIQIMHSSSASNVKFLILTFLVIIATASALAASWPYAHTAAQAQASNLIGEAGTANSAEAATDYQLATWLDPANPASYVGLAQTQILAGQAGAALVTLDRAGEGSAAAALRLRTLMELGRTNEAADQATALATHTRSDADIILASLADDLAGRTTDLPVLIPLVSSPEAAQRISHAGSGKLALAAELYASGLPESSRALLTKLPPSFKRDLLLGQIYYARHTESDLASATAYLESAVAFNPSDIPTRQLLASVYSDRQLTTESSNQTALVEKLSSGKP
jgi:Tfp pilus assembly protein PilF